MSVDDTSGFNALDLVTRTVSSIYVILSIVAELLDAWPVDTRSE
jgi:hypothetical protein